MVILHLFIDYHYKSIVSIIRESNVLTLHLSTANCRRKLTTGCCCKNVAALYCTRYAIYFYQIVSYHSSSSCGPFSMHFDGTLILLYFIEMVPRTVSSWMPMNLFVRETVAYYITLRIFSTKPVSYLWAVRFTLICYSYELFRWWELNAIVGWLQIKDPDANFYIKQTDMFMEFYPLNSS